jgi:CheY-like chemotaxis protein
LIINNDRATLTYLSGILKKEGYNTLLAEQGQEAFSIFNTRMKELGSLQIQVIICDWQISGGSGIQILSEIRHSPFKDTPFLFTSSVLTREELMTVAKHKANGVLIKPIDKAALIQKIKDLLKDQA